MDEMRVRICIDWENNNEEWWDAAHFSTMAPVAIQPLIGPGTKDRVTVTSQEWDDILQWAQSLPGWNDGPSHAPNPLIAHILGGDSGD